MKINNKRKKQILYTILMLILFFFFLKMAQMIAPDAYNYLEYYEFDITKKELVSAVMKFKEQNPRLNPPKNYVFYNNQEQNYNINDIFSHIYFYFYEEDYIVITMIGRLNNNKKESRLCFYRIVDMKDTTNNRNKTINKGLGCSENRRYLQMFEDRIVNPLRKQIESDKRK